MKCFLFYFKSFFVLEIFKFLFSIFGHVGKRLRRKANVNFKSGDVTNWTTNNYNTYIS